MTLENQDILGKLKLVWVRSSERKHENYNYRAFIFRNTVIEIATMKAPPLRVENSIRRP